MSRCFFIVLFVLIILPFAPLRAAEITADSAITAATVYTNRATVTRTAVVELPAGAHTVVFKDLPATLMPDSLRAEGTAAVPVTFGAVAHKMETGAALAAPREQTLTETLEALQDRRKMIEADKQALETRKTFIGALGEQAKLRINEEIAELELDPELWIEAGAVLQEDMAVALKAGLTHDIALRTLDREIQKVRAELNQLRTGQRNSYSVSVPLEAAAATTLTITLSYQLPNAAWQPLYDARLETEDGDLTLIQYGAVRQNTGEDWTDIALTLSTAQPHRGASLPPLNPMWVNIWSHRGRQESAMIAGAVSDEYRQIVQERNMAAVEGAVRSSDSFMPAPVAAELKVAQIDTGGFVSEYIIPGPSTVLADGTESKLMIGTFDTDTTLQVQVKPQLDSKAYLVARAALKGEAPILPGRVSLFRDGAYVGQQVFPLLRPGAETDLGFGIDDNIEVVRKLMKDERSEAGLISKDNVIERHFLTAVQNLHDTAVELVVLETVPTPQDDKIKVQVLDQHTSAGYETDHDNIKGLLRWVMTLPPQAQQDVTLGWKISWPDDSNLSGLQ